MRLWTLHPNYLDRAGLLAVWREGLLAQAVLGGLTKGYVRHPQLCRFRSASSPSGAIAAYLRAVHAEAVTRGYAFDAARIGRGSYTSRLTVTRGQLEFERCHLLAKLARRDPRRHARLEAVQRPRTHPLFCIVPGPVESWEKGADASHRGDQHRSATHLRRRPGPRQAPSRQTMNENWQEFEAYGDEASAEARAGLLRVEGIPTEIRRSTPVPGLNEGFRVMVPVSLAGRAAEVVAAAQVTDAELTRLATGERPDPDDRDA